MCTEIIITHASCTVKENNVNRRHFEIYFSDLFQKTGFDISCKLSPKETVCMKCQTLFPEQKKKTTKKNNKKTSNCCLLHLP